MTVDLYWTIAAFILIIVELMTGTFYLFVMGIAAFAGAGLAYYGFSFPMQAAGAAAVAALGVVLVYRRHARGSSTSVNAIDVGQPVTVESWIDKDQGLVRVRYRGALWDARIAGESGAAGVYYIRRVEGNLLHIAARG
jgi:membrane protein implicated in regulation of membrane protease activity